MRIGIVTLFAVPNYGAMLQAYALWRTLESEGHVVKFIDYKFSSMEKPSFLRSMLSRRLSTVPIKLKKYFRHEITRFADFFPRTKRIDSAEELRLVANEFDEVIVGSDQIWSPRWAAAWDSSYVFLDFVKPSARRISYAASFGVSVWSRPDLARFVGQHLRRFFSISVREPSAIAIVKNLSGRNDVCCMPDPTLLQKKSFYEEIQAWAPAGPYVFAYLLDEFRGGNSAVEIIKHALGIDRVLTDKCPVSRAFGSLLLFFGINAKVTVPEWLGRISCAEFVITNSFHGTVFSILYHRPFATILLDGTMSGMNERVTSLLSTIGLSERAVAESDTTKLMALAQKKIDWASVDERIEQLRWRGCRFLKESTSADRPCDHV